MWRLVKFTAFNAPVFVFVVHNVGSVVRVEGESMQPTLNPKGKRGNSDYVFLSKWSVREFNISRGQVVALISPKNCDQNLIKRIIALEGDFVKTKSNESVQIPKGHCWVEGDAKHSYDSNHFGAVAIGLIYARATHVIWPPKRWAKLGSIPFDELKTSSESSEIF